MKKELEIQRFIRAHSDWEKTLSEKPYCISISRDVVCGQNLVMFKYSQIDSDFNLNIVRECRGLILNEDTFDIVSYPFYKFGNYGEGYCPDIDWKSAVMLEKIDGSLIKIVRLGKMLLISTNGTIDAGKAPVAEQLGCPYSTFKDIVVDVLNKKGVHAELFAEGFTYMFELVSPWTRVVIPYPKADLYFLGYRNNITLEEKLPYGHLFDGDFFDVPKRYDVSSIDDCLAMAKDLPWDEEGYVVVDSAFNRVKVKSPAWLAVHHLKGENGVMSIRRAIEIVRANEIDEICSYFEEFRAALNECKERFNSAIEKIEKLWISFLEEEDAGKFSCRKDQALYIQREFKQFSGIAFALLDAKVESVKDWFFNQPADKVLRILGYKE